MVELKETASYELIVKDRKSLVMNGVINVLDFTEEVMTLSTERGNVVIEGADMKIENLSKDDGKITVIGRIDGFYYKSSEDKKSFVKRIFG